jgi:putative peptide zinc metalloprotease protein
MSIIPAGNSPVAKQLGGHSAPPIKMRIRADLACTRVTYQGVEYWVVKDPLAQKYFQFPPHVYFLLCELNGSKSIDQLQESYHKKYAPKRITRSDLQQLLTRFHKDNLVTSEMPGQGIELLNRGRKTNRMELLQKFSNILAIRYRGFDPERMLNFLNRYTWWLFTPTAAVITLIMAAIALLSVLVNWTAFQSKLPGFDDFFDVRQWYLFVAVLAGTKIFHEFGHGLACKRMGGECHEIGFMLLVLTPCLYCNVTDSWRLPNKWHRAAIGAAGMYIEVILATIATFVWWFVQPGMVQDICLRVMLVSSISTILFNGNPLLRFDGYYILSDILEIPNLHQKANRALNTLLGRHWLGLEIPDDQLMPANRPWAFALFTVAAFCYRWFILVAIITFLIRFLEPYGVESIGIGLALFSIAGMVGMPLFKLYKYLSVPGRMHQVKKKRFFVVLAIASAVIAAIMFVPYPHYLRCNLVVMPKDIETVWIKEPGTLQTLVVKPGETVVAGQPLVVLENLDLNLEILEIESQIKEKELEENAILKQSSNQDSSSLDQLPRVHSERAKLIEMASTIRKRRQNLEVTSPIQGTVMATPYRHQRKSPEEIEDVDDSSLLEGKHQTVFVPAGTRLCEVADLSRWYAVVILSENQRKFAKRDQMVKMKLYSAPTVELESKIESLAETDQTIDRERYEPTQPGQPAGKMTESRPPDLIMEMVAALDQSSFQYVARVPLPESEVQRMIGQGGQARIFAGYRSLGARAWWWFNENFRF